MQFNRPASPHRYPPQEGFRVIMPCHLVVPQVVVFICWYSTHSKLTYPTWTKRKSYLCGENVSSVEGIHVNNMSIPKTVQNKWPLPSDSSRDLFGMVIQCDLLRGQKWPPRIGDKSRPGIESPEPIPNPPDLWAGKDFQWIAWGREGDSWKLDQVGFDSYFGTKPPSR